MHWSIIVLISVSCFALGLGYFLCTSIYQRVREIIHLAAGTARWF